MAVLTAGNLNLFLSAVIAVSALPATTLSFPFCCSVISHMFFKMNKSQNFTPGYIMVLHTFGRDLKWNSHIHCLIFEGGYSYDGVFVTFHYNRHEDEKYVEETLPAMDFIKRLIRHIPEKHFKMIRYGGIYARHPAGCFQFTRTPTTVFPIKKKRLQCD